MHFVNIGISEAPINARVQEVLKRDIGQGMYFVTGDLTTEVSDSLLLYLAM